jgi:hypothetical protein
MSYDMTPLYLRFEKPRFRIQWDYEDGKVIGFWLWTCNFPAIELQPSKYYPL